MDYPLLNWRSIRKACKLFINHLGVYNKYLAFILLIVAFLISCSNFSVSNENAIGNRHQAKSFYDFKWLDTLNMNSKQMKEAFVGYYHYGILERYLTIEDYNLPPQGETFVDYSLIAVERYDIDYSTLTKWKAAESTDALLKINKNYANAFLVNGANFIFRIQFRRESNRWKTVGYGPFTKQYSTIISLVSSQKKHHFFYVNIGASNLSKSRATFLVYELNGVLMRLTEDGASLPFKDELLALRKKISNNEE